MSAQAQIRFDLPAQPLARALTSVGSLANLNIFFDPPLLEGLQAPALRAELSADDALARLLAGTSLRAVHVNENTVRVVDAAQKRAQGAHAADTGATYTPAPVHLAYAGTGSEGGSQPGNSIGSANDSGSVSLAEVVVTSRYEFLSADTSGTTNLPLPIEKVPQSISLVSNDFIEAADLKTLGQIAEYTPGALNEGNPGNNGTVLWLRGFPAGLALDGINLGGSNFYEPDYAIFDRLEVVKGPSSVVYGVSSPGGLVNFVTKSATAQTVDYVSTQVGSWNSYRVEGQVAGALDPDNRLRAIGVAVYDKGDSFLDQMYHEKVTVYGGLNLNITDSVTAFVHGGYEHYARTAFDGIPTEPDGTPAPLSRSFCICSRSLEWTTDVYFASTDLTWHATDMLDFTLKGNYERSTLFGSFGYGYGLTPTGDLSLSGEIGVPSPNLNYGIEASSIYRFDALGLKNSFVSLSALYQENRDTQDVLFTNGGTANIFSGEGAVNQAIQSLFTPPTFPYSSLIEAKTVTFSAQSVLQLLDPLTLLLGASYSKPDETTVANGASEDFSIGGQMSYRAGLTYEFLPRTNAYISYSESFMPDAVGLTINQTALPPLSGQQYEGGVKYASPSGRLLLTGALFQIREKNVAEFAEQADGVEYFAPIGEVRHRGLELEALGHLTPQWQIDAGYSYLDPKITGALPDESATIGQRQLFLPTQSASVYSSYTFNSGVIHGLSVGGGLRYVGSQHTSYVDPFANVESGTSPSKDLPSYVLADANVGYSIGKWLFEVNAHNIFDRRYFINNYQTLFYGNVPGDPDNFALTIRRSF